MKKDNFFDRTQIFQYRCSCLAFTYSEGVSAVLKSTVELLSNKKAQNNLHFKQPFSKVIKSYLFLAADISAFLKKPQRLLHSKHTLKS